MMNENDYFMRLIKSGTELLVTIFSGKNVMDSLVNEQSNKTSISESNLLEIMINKYISEGKIDEAENLLFERINECKSASNYDVAISFYKKINTWSEEKLAECNFSKTEIIDGLKDVGKLYEQNNI